MNVVEIITDGSYAYKNIGVGCIRIKEKNDNGEYNFVVTSGAFRAPKISSYGSQAAEAMAVIVALNELQKISYTDKVIIYCDLEPLSQYINGYRNRVDPSIKKIFDELDECLLRHTSVTSMHPKHATHLPNYLHAIAHNASATESGSRKRESTGEFYIGKYAHRPNLNPKLKAGRAAVGQQFNGMAILGEDRAINYPMHDPRHPKLKF